MPKKIRVLLKTKGTWTFTYTSKYHLINEGINELTAKLSYDIGPFNATKYDSVNVIGTPTED
jgi:hypothetical protein